MTYNLTNFTEANNFLDLSIASNSLVDGWLFIFAIVMVFTITFIALKNSATDKAFLTASFITFVLTATLWAVGLVSSVPLGITFVLLLFGFVFNIIDT